MSARWVAGGVRSRALLHRRLTPPGTRRLAGAASLAEAVAKLGETPYRRGIRADMSLADAQRAVADTLLWHLRILAGWQPPEGAALVRELAAWFEVSNVVEHGRGLAGRPAAEPYRLGALRTAWSRVAAATTPDALRAALAATSWHDPGTAVPERLAGALHLAWATRVAVRVPEAEDWAVGALAILAARWLFLAGTPLPGAERLLGPRAADASTWPDYLAALPATAGWAVADVPGPGDLWRAEPAWWSRVEGDASRLRRASRYGRAQVVATVALLAADAWRLRAALELSARGGHPVEAFDALR